MPWSSVFISSVGKRDGTSELNIELIPSSSGCLAPSPWWFPVDCGALSHSGLRVPTPFVFTRMIERCSCPRDNFVKVRRVAVKSAAPLAGLEARMTPSVRKSRPATITMIGSLPVRGSVCCRRLSLISCSVSETLPMACAAWKKLCTGSSWTESSLWIESSLENPGWSGEDDCRSFSRVRGEKASKLPGWIINALASCELILRRCFVRRYRGILGKISTAGLQWGGAILT